MGKSSEQRCGQPGQLQARLVEMRRIANGGRFLSEEEHAQLVQAQADEKERLTEENRRAEEARRRANFSFPELSDKERRRMEAGIAMANAIKGL